MYWMFLYPFHHQQSKGMVRSKFHPCARLTEYSWTPDIKNSASFRRWMVSFLVLVVPLRRYFIVSECSLVESINYNWTDFKLDVCGHPGVLLTPLFRENCMSCLLAVTCSCLANLEIYKWILLHSKQQVFNWYLEYCPLALLRLDRSFWFQLKAFI